MDRDNLAVIALVASLITIFAFVTGIFSLPEALTKMNTVEIKTQEGSSPSEITSKEAKKSIKSDIVSSQGEISFGPSLTSTGLLMPSGKIVDSEHADIYAWIGPQLMTKRRFGNTSPHGLIMMGPFPKENIIECPKFEPKRFLLSTYSNYKRLISLREKYSYCMTLNDGQFYARVYVEEFNSQNSSSYNASIVFDLQRNGTRFF